MRRNILVGITYILLLALGQSAAAQETTSKINAKAKEVVEKSILFMKNQTSYKCSNTIHINMTVGGKPQTMVFDGEMFFQQPNKVAIHQKMGPMKIDTVSNGKKIFIYMSMLNAYMELDAPPTMDELNLTIMKQAAKDSPIGANQNVFNDLLFTQDPQKLWKVIQQANYLGEIEEDGKKYNRVSVTTKSGDIEGQAELWYPTGEDPSVYKIIPDMALAMAASKQPQLSNIKMNMEMIYTDWEYGIEIPETTFAFTPPAGAKKMSAESMMNPARTAADTSQKKDEFVNAPAPDFEIELFDTSTFKLSETKGKVVILTFWSSWSTPCKTFFPILDSALNEFKDKDIISLAINIREPKDRITRFLDRLETNPTVGLDKDKSIGKLYGAISYPTVVVIDRQGIVNQRYSTPPTEAELKDLIAGLLSQ
jgi:thiol-disulfide isomerase/thioredoxin/outer membrane lipoprotein-sorting protein